MVFSVNKVSMISNSFYKYLLTDGYLSLICTELLFVISCTFINYHLVLHFAK